MRVCVAPERRCFQLLITAVVWNLGQKKMIKHVLDDAKTFNNGATCSGIRAERQGQRANEATPRHRAPYTICEQPETNLPIPQHFVQRTIEAPYKSTGGTPGFHFAQHRWLHLERAVRIQGWILIARGPSISTHPPFLLPSLLQVQMVVEPLAFRRLRVLVFGRLCFFCSEVVASDPMQERFSFASLRRQQAQRC